MTPFFKTLPALALLALAAPLAAQEAPADPAAEATPETPPGPAPEATPEAAPEAPAGEAPAAEGEAPAAGPEALSMGTPVEGEVQVGQPYIREEFGDWALRCLRAEEGEDDPCQLYQLLEDADGNAVAEISMFPLAPGQQAAAGATIVAPLETLLTEELEISVDGTATRRYPFTFCNRAGCVARVGFTQEEVDQFRAGNAATLVIVPAAAPDEDVVLSISLTGFTAGYDSTTQTAPD